MLFTESIDSHLGPIVYLCTVGIGIHTTADILGEAC